MKRISDLTPFSNILPYASEIFGVYQPLIGWRSKRQAERMQRGFANDRVRARDGLLKHFIGNLDMRVAAEGQALEVARVGVGATEPFQKRSTATLVGDRIAALLPPPDRIDEAAWAVIDERRLAEMLRTEVVPQVQEWMRGNMPCVAAAMP